MKDFSIIVAMDKNRGIGRGGNLPWHLPSDIKFFKETTTQTNDRTKVNAVLMGRRTWESVPERFRPLTGRLNVIVSRNSALSVPDGCLKYTDLEVAFTTLDGRNDLETVFVIGGGSIYGQALSMPGCRSLHITRIDQAFECDTFFPSIPPEFQLCSESKQFSENGCSFSLLKYIKQA